MAKKKEVESTELVVVNEKELMFKQLTDQYAMSWEDQRNLIRSDTQLTQKGVSLAVKTAMSFGLPLQGINVIPTKNGPAVYVNSDGLRWRIHTDERGVKKSLASVIHRPTKDEPWIEVMATIVIGDDSEYVNFGVVDCLPTQGVGNGIMKATTKAKRRASVDAVGVALPIAEEYLEWADEQKASGKFVDAEFTIQAVPAQTITEPKNFSEFLSWLEQNNHTLDEATAIIEVNEIAANVGVAYNKLKETWKIGEK
jgi:hypothetical protein